MRHLRPMVFPLLLGAVIAYLAASAGPALTGMQPYAVTSGSMVPAIGVGDMVVDRAVRADTVRVGDIVTFHDATRGGELVTHRVRSVTASGVRGGELDVVTRGDANNATERWTIARDGTVGRVEYAVRHAGRVLAAGRTDLGRALLVFVPLALLALGELRRIWRRDDDPAEPARA